MRRLIIILLLAAAVQPVRPAGHDANGTVRIAVLDFNSLGLTGDESEMITASFRKHLKDHLAFSVYETARMYTVMSEKGYPREIPCTDDSCIIELGGVLGVDYIVAANIGKVGDIFSLSLWMLEVQTGHVVATVMENFQTGFTDFRDVKLRVAGNRIANSLQMMKRGRFPDAETLNMAWVKLCRENGKLPTNKVLSIAEDRKGVIWIGMKEQGVLSYDGKTWTRYTTRHGLADNDVWAIGVDRNNVKWFGTVGGGVTRFDGKRWRSYSIRDGLVSDYISGVVPGQGSEMWFLSWDSGVSVLRNGRFVNYSDENGLIDNDVRCLCLDRSGAVWFGTYKGVSRLSGTKWQSYVSGYTYGHRSGDGNCELVDNYIRSIAEDDRGRMWFGTYGGISMFHEDTWFNYTQKNGLIDNNVQSLQLDRVGNLWCGTYGGVSRFDGEEWVSYTSADGLVDDDIKLVVIDHLDNKWFCSSAKGISVYVGE